MTLLAENQRNIVHAIMQHGDMLAIESSVTRMSYQLLGQHVNSLSQRLSSSGVKKGEHVGVLGLRSVTNIIAFLSILNIGATYVPINARLSNHRKTQLISGADIRTLLYSDTTEIDRLGGMPQLASAGVQAICFSLADILLDASNSGTQTSMPHTLGAYIIFTSGTTGKPKPVLVSRGALDAHNRAVIERYGLNRNDRVLHICANSFDISIEEILPSLAVGACVVVGPDIEGISVRELLRFLQGYNISIANLPTALWCAWCDDLQQGDLTPSGLTRIIIGGEACPPEHFRQWMMGPHRSITCVNAYGPTETTITITAWDFLAFSDPQVPVGKSLKGVDCYILDAQLQPLMVMEVGELYVGGDFLALGYYQLPKVTARSFLPNPFAHKSGERMYGTGDLAYIGSDGNIHICGRSDRQLKINGFRIEPGEIEAGICSHYSVKQAFVAVVEINESKKIIAYLYLDTPGIPYNQFFYRNENPLLESIHNHLANLLPSYTLPAYYCCIDTVPLTSNGKVDHGALPHYQMSSEQRSNQCEFTNVSAPVMECVAGCLGYFPQDISLSFIALGGDSISAMRLSSQLWQKGLVIDNKQLLADIGLDIVLSNIYTRSQINSNVEHQQPLVVDGVVLVDFPGSILQQIADIGWGAASEIEFLCRCSDTQIGMLYQSVFESKTGRFIEQVEGPLDDLNIDVFIEAWKKICDRHAVLRSSFCLGLSDSAVHIAYKTVELQVAIENWAHLDESSYQTQLKLFLAKDSATGFALTRSPMFRLNLIKLSRNRYHFIWTYHHAILDGWSDVHVLQEVFQVYENLVYNKPLKLAMPGRYPDFLQWQANNDVQRDAMFWQDYLHGIKPEASLFPVLAATGDGDESIVYLSISEPISRQFKQFVKASEVTLNTAFCAVLGWVIADYFNSDECIIGTASTIRPKEIENIESLVGPLINLIPTRIRIDAQCSIKVWLKELLASYLMGESSMYVPYGTILQTINRSISQPLFNTLLVMENYPVDSNSVVSQLKSHTKTNQPLNFIVWPGDSFFIEVHCDRNIIDTSVFNKIVGNFVRLIEKLPLSDLVGDLAVSDGSLAPVIDTSDSHGSKETLKASNEEKFFELEL